MDRAVDRAVDRAMDRSHGLAKATVHKMTFIKDDPASGLGCLLDMIQ